MDLYGGKLCVFLFLPLTIGGSNVFLDKYIGTEVDDTPICSGEMIVAIHCNVKNKESGLSVCSLLYIPTKVNQTRCGPRISLMTQNHTVFLRLVNLTRNESGVYSCECTGNAGVSEVQLNVYVKGNGQYPFEHTTVNFTFTFLYSIIIIPVIVFGVILGCIYRKRCKQRSEPATTRGEEMETYAPLRQPTNDVYHTFKKQRSEPVTTRGEEMETYAPLRQPTNDVYHTFKK